MAPLEISALTCGLCQKSGIAAWRSDYDAPFDVIFVSESFLHDATAPEAAPAFLCVECKHRAGADQMLKDGRAATKTEVGSDQSEVEKDGDEST